MNFRDLIKSARAIPAAKDEILSAYRTSGSPEMAAILQKARLYFATSDFTDLVTLTIPPESWDTFSFTRPDVGAGMVFFEKTAKVQLPHMTFYPYAVLWGTQFVPAPGPGEPNCEAIVYIWLGCDEKGKNQGIAAGGWYEVEEASFTTETSRWVSDIRNDLDTHNLFYLGCLISTLLQFPNLVEVEERQPDQMEKKRARKRHKAEPPPVTIINLRKAVGHNVAQAKQAEREYRHRWIVRGHTRQQPCGPGRRDRRTVVIAPYVKGPQGAPLIKKEKVYRW